MTPPRGATTPAAQRPRRSEPPPSSAPARLTRATSGSRPSTAAPARRPWLLGAGVGIGLTMGLLVLLALFLAGAKARPAKRSAARTTPRRPPEEARPRPARADGKEPSTRRKQRPAEPEAARPKSNADSPSETAPDPAQNGPVPAATYLVFVPTADGYRLVERTGAPPEPGAPVHGDELSIDGDFVVARVGPSPLPLDERRCVFLERSDA
jgi:hypothetical protein